MRSSTRSWRRTGKSLAPADAKEAMAALIVEQARPDADEWIAALRGPPAVREQALARLHALTLRAARFELERRRSALGQVPADELDDLAAQAAADAMVALLAKLDRFRGQSRFTTWAYKFALLEASVKARRRAWQSRELPLTEEGWGRLEGTTTSPATAAATGELLAAIRDAIAN